AAGMYSFQVTITNPGGRSTSSIVTVVVNQTATSVGITPSSMTVETGMTSTFAAGTLDQFGAAMTAGQPAVTWSVTNGGGSVSSSGVYTAPAVTGSATISATAPGLGTVNATVTIVNTLQVWYQANAASGTTLADSSGHNL